MVLFPLKNGKNGIFEKFGYEMCKLIVWKLKNQFLTINTTSINDLCERNTFIWQNVAWKYHFCQGFKCKKIFPCHGKKLRTIKYQSKTAGILIKCSPISTTTLIRVTAIFDEFLRVLNFFYFQKKWFLAIFGLCLTQIWPPNSHKKYYFACKSSYSSCGIV